jgi:hypothetical protein
VGYQINASGVGATGCTQQEAEAAVTDAMDAWGLASRDGGSTTCTDFHFDPAAAPTTTRTAIGRDGVNLIVFRSGRCLAGETPAANNCWDTVKNGIATIGLTTTTFDDRTGQILDSDIELFAWDGITGTPGTGGDGFDFTCGGTPVVDARTVVMHEAGHMLGLDHPCTHAPNPVLDPGYPGCTGAFTQIMAPQISTVSAGTLHIDDVDGICTIYPKAAATAICPPVEGPDSGGGGCSSAGGASVAGLLLAAFAGSRLGRRRRQR